MGLGKWTKRHFDLGSGVYKYVFQGRGLELGGFPRNIPGKFQAKGLGNPLVYILDWSSQEGGGIWVISFKLLEGLTFRRIGVKPHCWGNILIREDYCKFILGFIPG